MRKIKIFTNTNTDLLEIDINKWFDEIENDGLEIIETYQSQSYNSNNCYDYVTITFIYKDSKAELAKFQQTLQQRLQALGNFSAPDLGNINDNDNDDMFNLDF